MSGLGFRVWEREGETDSWKLCRFGLLGGEGGMVSQVLLRVWYQGRALTPEFSSLTRFNLNFQEERRRGGQEFSVLSSSHGFYNSSNKFSTNGHGLQVAAHSQVSISHFQTADTKFFVYLKHCYSTLNNIMSFRWTLSFFLLQKLQELPIDTAFAVEGDMVIFFHLRYWGFKVLVLGFGVTIWRFSFQ